MTKVDKTTWSYLISTRFALGLLAGLFTWLVLAYFQQPGGYSPLISVIIIMLVSGSFDHKYLVLSGAIIGVVGGLVIGFQWVLQRTTPVNVFTLIAGVFMVGISMVMNGIVVAFLGLFVASVVGLYKRGAII